MAETVVKPNAQGRFRIPPARKDNQRNVEVDLGATKPEDVSVIVKTMALPAKYDRENISINWFAVFGIRHKNQTLNVNGFAAITYTVTIDALPEGKRLFAYYAGEVYEVTDFQTSGTRTSFTLPNGDPGIGYGP
jgi:hypothetical protein